MITKEALFELARALEGLPVLGSLAGTPASRAGVRYGDVLISVNGVRTRSFFDYIEAKALRTDGMDLVVFRSGAEQAAALAFDEEAPPIDPVSLVAELVSLRIVPGPEGAGDIGGSGSGINGVS